MTVSRAELAEALDGAIMHLVTVRRMLDETEDDIAPELPPEDWRGPCPDAEGRHHDLLWVRGGMNEPEGLERGVCRACGLEFERGGPE